MYSDLVLPMRFPPLENELHEGRILPFVFTAVFRLGKYLLIE